MSDAKKPSEALRAQQFRQDPRLAEARRLILAALVEHRSRLDGVVDPSPELAADYRQLLDQLTAARGAAPYFPYLASGLGNGPWVELADGSVKLDFISGIGVYGLGHSDPAMVDASVAGAIEDVVMQGNLQQHPPSLRLCQRLIALAQEGGAAMEHCLLTTSGAMANENALKILLHHRSPADRILCFDNCFAGRSLATAALTDRPQYRAGLPLTLEVDYLPFWDASSPEASTRRAVEVLQKHLQRHPGRYAAFWGELVAGEGGYYPGDTEFFRALCQPLRAAGVPIVFDEIQTFARLSQPFAFAHFGLGEWADVVTIGKITQVCATLYRGTLKPKAPILSQTFTGASASIACGLAMLDQLQRAGCFGSAKGGSSHEIRGENLERGAYFAAGMERLIREYPRALSGPFGAGMMMAFTPGKGDGETAKWFVDELYAEGLMGFVCGATPTRIRFLPPPAATTRAHLDVALGIIGRVAAKYMQQRA